MNTKKNIISLIWIFMLIATISKAGEVIHHLDVTKPTPMFWAPTENQSKVLGPADNRGGIIIPIDPMPSNELIGANEKMFILSYFSIMSGLIAIFWTWVNFPSWHHQYQQIMIQRQRKKIVKKRAAARVANEKSLGLKWYNYDD